MEAKEEGNYHLMSGEEEEVEEEEEEEEEEVKWANHYSSLHEILLVGDGDFSFSLSLATAFGSASNIVATSFDPHEILIKKYSKAYSNLENLKKMGATILHGVDATKMKLHADLKMRKFDRIVFNFPHAGFKGKEDHIRLINLHRNLVCDFFRNASRMLHVCGEVHVSHKTTVPFIHWNLEELGLRNYLVLVERVVFKIEDYPGYNNKRGDGNRCDQPFPLGECSTYKFRIGKPPKRKAAIPNVGHIYKRPITQISEHYPGHSGIITRSNYPIGPITQIAEDYPGHSCIITRSNYPIGPITQNAEHYPGHSGIITRSNYPIGPITQIAEHHSGHSDSIIRSNYSIGFSHYPRNYVPQLSYTVDMEAVPGSISSSPRVAISNVRHGVHEYPFADVHNAVRNSGPDSGEAVRGFMRRSYEMYMNEVPGRTRDGYSKYLQGLRHSSVLRAVWLDGMLHAPPHERDAPWRRDLVRAFGHD